MKHKSRGDWGWLGKGMFLITAFVYPTVPGRCQILFRTLFKFDWARRPASFLSPARQCLLFLARQRRRRSRRGSRPAADTSPKSPPPPYPHPQCSGCRSSS